MASQFFIDRIYERDVDLVLIEEFAISATFAKWVLTKTSNTDPSFDLVEVHGSLADESGESDVTAIFSNAEGVKHALLIENKIDAIFQPAQLERYRRRGDKGINDKKWQSFKVVVVAPQSYIDRSSYCSNADACITYEEIATYFRTDLSKRSAYRATFFENATPRGATAYVRNQDEVTNRFWNEAYLIARRDYPKLSMKEPDFARGTVWVSFRPGLFPKGLVLDMKGGQGFVDLTFSGVNEEVLRNAIKDRLPQHMWIQQTGKSAVIRQISPSFQVANDFETARNAIIQAFDKCYELIALFEKHRVDLTSALQEAGRLRGVYGSL